MTTDSTVPSYSTNATAPADQNFEAAPVSDGSLQSSFTFGGLTFAQTGGVNPWTTVWPAKDLYIPVGLDSNVAIFNGNMDDGVNRFAVSSADGSSFRLASFDMVSFVYNTMSGMFNGAQSVRIAGYKDGLEVVSDNVDLSMGSSGFGSVGVSDRFVGKNGSDDASIKARLTFDASGWGNIDSILIEGNFATFTTIALDNIDLEPASVPDTTPPSVVSIVRSGNNPALTNGNTLTYTVTFNEAVIGVTADDFSLSMTGSATGTITSVSTSDSTSYTVTVSDVSGAGDIRLDLKGTGTGIQDANNNAITTGYTSGQSYSVDGIAPQVTGVSSLTANGVYAIGDTITVTVSFSEAVTVSGTPQLMLKIGGYEVPATYVSGSGSSMLAFTYTVGTGDLSLDLEYASSTALQLNGGAIRDAVGNNASLTLAHPGTAGSLGANKAIVIDGVAPTVISASIDGSSLVLTYSEDMSVWGGANALISGFIVKVDSQIVAIANRVFGADGRTVVITLDSPVTKGQSVEVIYEDPTSSDDGDAVQDVAGNDSPGFVDLPVTNLTADSQKPVVTGVSIPNKPMALGEVVTVTITVDADADTYSLGPNSHVGPYALTGLVKVNDTTYTAKFTVTELTGPSLPGEDINVGISLIDGAQNLSNFYNQPIVQDNDRFDLTRPDLVSASVNGSTLSLNFSEALDLTNLPPSSAFVVLVDGNAVAVSGVSGTSAGQGMTLQLASPVTKGQSVAVSYVDPTSGNDAKAIQDVAGNDAASFTGVTVANATTGNLVDGVEVVETVSRGNDGIRTKSILVQPVQPGRVNDTGSAAFADIELNTIEGKAAILAQLATGAGLNAEMFDPLGNISRQDFAIILAKALNFDLSSPVIGRSSFGDIGSSISDWASKYVEAAIQNGLLNAVSEVKLTGFADRDTLLNGMSTYANVMVLDASSDGIRRKVQVNDIGFIALKGSAEIYGGNGAQFIVADNASQRIVMGADDDTIHGGGGDDYVGSLAGNDELHGDEGNDTVSGGIGNDTLDGGTGIDIMYGGAGNDTYYVDMRSDTVVEYRGEGTDTVQSSVSFVLSNGNIENLVLTGTAASGYGNGLSNKMQASGGGSMLYGWGGNDTLYGGASRDRLYGSSGDDRLYGNGGNDRLYGGSGKDRLDGSTGRDYLAGEGGNDVLKGGDGHDTISGGSGNDVIYGERGADVLYGSYGRDVFVFDTRIGRGEVDSIRSFDAKNDTVRLENAIFKKVGGTGSLDRDAFCVARHAMDAEDRIIFDVAKGALYYDKDGVGGAAQVQFAKLDKHLLLTVDDFQII
ncbi:SwmB domain-containing protein [Microvirga soli]|uniref:SwmB domain-containing protein n=1 Tax=Microvirga soli TaxID=1854496 RepID=UPI00191D71B8|nr:SwmB domain-containing protein [Microvirga soli]